VKKGFSFDKQKYVSPERGHYPSKTQKNVKNLKIWPLRRTYNVIIKKFPKIRFLNNRTVEEKMGVSMLGECIHT